MKNAVQKFNAGCAKLFVHVKGKFSNERGATTVEWVGLAFVILMLMFAVQAAMEGKGDSLAGAITGKITEIVGKVGKGD